MSESLIRWEGIEEKIEFEGGTVSSRVAFESDPSVLFKTVFMLGLIFCRILVCSC